MFEIIDLILPGCYVLLVQSLGQFLLLVDCQKLLYRLIDNVINKLGANYQRFDSVRSTPVSFRKLSNFVKLLMS